MNDAPIGVKYTNIDILANTPYISFKGAYYAVSANT